MKNLENEYRQQIANEVPNLWSRIEAGITAIDKQRENNNNVVSIEQAKPKKKFNILKYSAVIGAAACALIVVVAIINNSNHMSESAMPSATMQEASEAYDNFAAEEAAPAAYYESDVDATACESAEAVCEEAAVEEDTSNKATRESFAATKSTETCESPEMTEEAEEEACDNVVVSAKLTDMTITEHHMIITLLSEDEEILVFVPDEKIEEADSLKMNQNYDFILYEYSDEEAKEIIENGTVTYEFIGIN